MYELGLAHSFNKKTIIITRDDLGKLPFDLKQYRAKDYSTHFKKFFDLIEYLEKNLRGAVNGTVVFSNPVSDFLDKNRIQLKSLFVSDDYSLEIPEGEKGFLTDYIKALHKMMLSIKEANQSVTVMKETSLNNLGIERSMNQSIRFLDQDLSEYLDMTEQMVKSIERIIGKSRFIIGDVPLE